MAVSSDRTPADGITFARFLADSANHANKLIPSPAQAADPASD
jgi:hypothetical protein